MVDIQSRGIAELQGDVTVRGGLFEGTGFKIGAVSLIDPQTGHYAGDLPIDPNFLEYPRIRTGIDNTYLGFNSTSATIDFGNVYIAESSSLSVGLGDHDSQIRQITLSDVLPLPDGYQTGVSYAASSGDGTLDFGDYDLERATLALRRTDDSAATSVLVSWQRKFFGWPGMYTGRQSLAETDYTKTGLILVDHLVQKDESGWWNLSGYYRRLRDDYDFNRFTRESGAPGSFDHETESFGLGVEGNLPYRQWQIDFGSQFSSDRLVNSTDLLGGSFEKRRYFKAGIVPTLSWDTGSGLDAALRVGVNFDWSDEDGEYFSPLVGVSLGDSTATDTRLVTLEYSVASQVPGYTALKSGVSGLFGGNPLLERELARTLQLQAKRESSSYEIAVTGFIRWDDELIDWTYSVDSPFSRQANPVDMDTLWH